MADLAASAELRPRMRSRRRPASRPITTCTLAFGSVRFYVDSRRSIVPDERFLRVRFRLSDRPIGEVEQGERLIWLPRDVLAKLNRLRAPGESYSDVILALAEAHAGR
jgi:hypothetical protein